MGLKKNAQAFTGASKQRGNTYPHINAARDLADRIGVTKNPLDLRKLETITEKRYSDVVTKVSIALSPPPYHRLRQWDFDTSSTQDSNTAASTSKIMEVEETPNLLERFTSLEVSDKEAKAKHQRKKRHQLALEKRFQKSLSKGKGKEKESVHPEPSSLIAPDVGNVRLFEETPVEERLDWGTDSANDDHSNVDDNIAESAGLDTGMYHTSHLYNDGDGHDMACYDHYELSRQVAPLFLEANTDDSQQRLLWLVESSLESKIDLIIIILLIARNVRIKQMEFSIS